MSVTLKSSTIKLRNSDGTITEPSFLKGDSATTLHDYAKRGGYTGTQANLVSVLNNPSDPCPVGTVFITANSASPASKYGGTWIQIQDRFLLAAGSEFQGATSLQDFFPNFSSANYTINPNYLGGEEKHTLSVAELPSHTHTFYGSTSTSVTRWGRMMLHTRFGWETVSTSAGSTQPHNNMPPFMVKNIWVRIS